MSTASHPALRDLLYFDRDRAGSIYSQFYGGLLHEIETRSATEGEETARLRLKLNVLEGELGDASRESASRTEASVLHHALLVEAEQLCFRLGVAADLNERLAHIDAPEFGQLRSVLSDVSYLRAEGQAVFEDHLRLKEIAKNFNDLLEFIGRSVAGDALERLPRFQAMQGDLQEHAVMAQASEGKKKAEAVSRFMKSQRQIRDLIFSASDMEPISDWLVEAIELWIDLFMPNRLNLRIYPFSEVPEFQVICNLKRDCFVNDDLETIRLAYGSYPDVDLTVFGLITSLPPVRGIHFEPLPEFRDADADGAASPTGVNVESDSDLDEASTLSDPLDEEADDDQARLEFEKAFRGVFGAAEGLERFVRFSRFPSVVIQPIAVYRKVRLPEIEVTAATEGWLKRLWWRLA